MPRRSLNLYEELGFEFVDSLHYFVAAMTNILRQTFCKSHFLHAFPTGDIRLR